MTNHTTANEIQAILDLPHGRGTFRRGNWMFSWGTGLAHSRLRTRYRRAIDHELPAWVEELHPHKAARLYALALDGMTKLPKTLDR